MTEFSEKRIVVGFADKATADTFNELKNCQDKKPLVKAINRTIDKLKENPEFGQQIPQSLFPKEYVKRYNINNLWRHELPLNYRMIYTIRTGNKIEILACIIEICSHSKYNGIFGYKK